MARSLLMTLLEPHPSSIARTAGETSNTVASATNAAAVQNRTATAAISMRSSSSRKERQKREEEVGE
jgi:hypothetical protein